MHYLYIKLISLIKRSMGFLIGATVRAHNYLATHLMDSKSSLYDKLIAKRDKAVANAKQRAIAAAQVVIALEQDVYAIEKKMETKVNTVLNKIATL